MGDHNHAMILAKSYATIPSAEYVFIVYTPSTITKDKGHLGEYYFNDLKNLSLMFHLWHHSGPICMLNGAFVIKATTPTYLPNDS